MTTLQKLGIDTWERDKQLALADEILRLHDFEPYSGLSPEHLADLQRRLDEDDANPEEGTPIEEVIRMMYDMVQAKERS